METKEKLKNVTDFYKGRVFSLSSEIGEGQLNHKATCLKSYNYILLCKVKKSFTTGEFYETNIFKIVLDQDGEEVLQGMKIDYETALNMPSKYSASDDVVQSKFNDIVSQLQLKFFGSEVASSRKKRESELKDATEKIRMDNIAYIKTRQAEIYTALVEKCAGIEVKKLAGDGGIVLLLSEYTTLDNLKKFTTK
jgi:hypothetical protein